MMNGESETTDYSSLYAQAKEILAAGMLAELKEDADEAAGKGEGEDTCPHCGQQMGGYGKPMLQGLGGMESEGEGMGMPMLPPNLALRMPPQMPSPAPARPGMMPGMRLGA